MTPDLTLHYAPDNASLCVRLLLDEMGTPYCTKLVDRSLQAQKSESYLKMDNILNAAKLTGADAFHPGYGWITE